MKKPFLLIYSLICLGIVTGKAQYSDLLNFNGSISPQGAGPMGSLIVSGTTLYGMTTRGAYSDGCIFSFNTIGNVYTDLLDFNGTNGGLPGGSLILSGTTLYGMTFAGGAHNHGCIFSFNTSGNVYTDLFDFNTLTTGDAPEGSLILSGTILYGMTYAGGTSSEGNIFSFNTVGNIYTDLLDFHGPNGEEPWGDLKLSGTTLYGMTEEGGAYRDGCIFSFNTIGNVYTDLLDFNGTNGEGPLGSLILSGTTLYGMTEGGGAYGNGCIFSLNTIGNVYTDLLDFNGTNGNAPRGSLILSGTNLYGMTHDGGAYSNGCVFSIDTNGNVYTDLFDFNGTYGSGPSGSLILLGTTLYGMTTNGGAYGKGVVFGDTIIRARVSIPAYVSCNGGSNGSILATPLGGTSPFTYSWSGGGSNAINTGLTAGTYTVTITDNNGLTATASITITQPTAIVITHDSVNETAGCNGVAGVNVSGGTAPYTYYWSAGHSDDTINNKCAGIYTCVITDNNGCAQIATVSINNTTGIENINSSSDVNIYPDPNTGYFTISGVTQDQVIELYNCMGQKLSSIIADNVAVHFDISNKTNGIYFIRILNKDGSIATQNRIIKMQ